MLTKLLTDVFGLTNEVTWAIDIRTGGAALLVAVLLSNEQRVPYLSGHMVNRAADGYRGQGKTDYEDHGLSVLLPV